MRPRRPRSRCRGRRAARSHDAVRRGHRAPRDRRSRRPLPDHRPAPRRVLAERARGRPAVDVADRGRARRRRASQRCRDPRRPRRGDPRHRRRRSRQPASRTSTVGVLRDDDATTPRPMRKGAFTLAGLAPGSYALAAHSDDYRLRRRRRGSRSATKDVDGVRVRVRRGVHLKGRVDPRAGRATSRSTSTTRPGAACGCRCCAAATSRPPTARSSSGHSPPGSVHRERALPERRRRQRARRRRRPGMAEVVIAVKPGASIAGRVVDAKGKPVAGASVNARDRRIAPRSSTA